MSRFLYFDLDDDEIFGIFDKFIEDVGATPM
jgi:hypothetical protein